MFAGIHLNRIQRKVLLVVVVIIVVPSLLTGVFSANWVAGRVDTSIERWIREAAEINRASLTAIHGNSQLFADLLTEVWNRALKLQPGKSPVPARLLPLATQMDINLIQLYDLQDHLLYSSKPLALTTTWAPGQSSAVVKVSQGQTNHLAAVSIIRVPHDRPRYQLVLGTVFDKAYLRRLEQMSGLKTRLFYPREGDFAKAFSEEDRPLKLRLPPSAFTALKNRQDYYSTEAENGSYWGLYTPLVDSTGRVEAVLFSGLRRHGGDQLLADKTALALTIALLGTLLAALAGIVLSRLVVKPIEYLRDGVMRVAAQDFRATIPLHSADELGELAQAFNNMAHTLREARDEERRSFQRDKIAALGELSLAMAHEIRNPIGVISTASKLMESVKEPERLTELRRMIREESLRLDQLLKDFQQLARHRQPEFSRIDPAEPLRKALNVMLAGRENIAVEEDFDHAGALISADAELLRQAWVNLVRNALEAIGPDGGRLRVGSRVDGKQVELYLQDSGPGIPEEMITRLFEPFFTTKDQGSGLGLTIANTLMEANGAQLALDPTVTEGARFLLHMPIAAEDD